jgi:recombination protein RecR
MVKFPSHLATLISFLKKLPGVGTRTAERYAFHLLDWKEDDIVALAQHLIDIKKKISLCSDCHALMEEKGCPFCDLSHRDARALCIVGSPKDIYPIEETRAFRGIYHVLGALLSPLQKLGPQNLRIDLLKERINRHNVEEIIIALDSTLEGDATALYLKKELETLPHLRVSRLASGLPLNSTLDFIDGGTLAKALSGRCTL